MTPRCPECVDVYLEPAEERDEHVSPAGARYRCPECGLLWEQDGSGLLIEAE
jgi:predicted RNA-binding Zn-ribbon protein involved in translation (DUF1610 family)